MNIKQLEDFLAIIEEGSITKAAKRLHIAQPPLSHQLKLLEDELEIKLIERNTRNFQITGAGEILQYRTEQILELLNITINELKNYNRKFQGTLSVGIVPSSGAILLPKLLCTFHVKYPDMNFKIREGNTYKILELLTNAIIDVGIVRTPFNSEIFESILLPSEPMLAVTRGDLYWAKEQKSISVADLINKPLIVDRRFETMIVSSCEKAGFKPRILCESDDVRSTLLWTDTGIGVGIIQKLAVGLIQSEHLIYKEINEPSLETRTAVLWLKSRHLPTITKEFLETFKGK